MPVEARFFVAAVLYGLFAIPLFLVVREPAAAADAAGHGRATSSPSLGQLRTTILARAGRCPGLPRFLVGRFFYSDAVNTMIVVMSVVATEAMGLTTTSREPDPAHARRSSRSRCRSVGAALSTGWARSGR